MFPEICTKLNCFVTFISNLIIKNIMNSNVKFNGLLGPIVYKDGTYNSKQLTKNRKIFYFRISRAFVFKCCVYYNGDHVK